MNSAFQNPGTAYHDGRIFAAVCSEERRLDVECLQCPSSSPHWVTISLIDLRRIWVDSLIIPGNAESVRSIC